jgi:hypothetical protein
VRGPDADHGGLSRRDPALQRSRRLPLPLSGVLGSVTRARSSMGAWQRGHERARRSCGSASASSSWRPSCRQSPGRRRRLRHPCRHPRPPPPGRRPPAREHARPLEGSPATSASRRARIRAYFTPEFELGSRCAGAGRAPRQQGGR